MTSPRKRAKRGSGLHEASYALSIIDAILNELNKRGLKGVRVTKVKVKVGELSLVDPIALKNSFEAYALGSPLQGATLEVEVVPSKFRCKRCGHEWSFKELYPSLKTNLPILHLYPHLLSEILKCPRCGSPEVEILEGEEFVIESFEYQREDGQE